MSEQTSNDRLHPLMERLVNGTISAAEHDELQALLLNNADAQAEYFEFIDLHAGLQKLTAIGPADDVLPEPTHITLGHTQSASSGVNRRRSAIALVVTIAAALILFVALPAFLERGQDTDPQHADDTVPDSQRERNPVEQPSDKGEVILAQSAGAELFGEFLPPVGEPLEFEHEYALVSGMIELRFPEGAEVILEAPAVIEIADRDRLIVSTGDCSVHAPPGAEGFQVETPQTEITDLGTRFSVSVSEVGETDVQVLEGLAEVRETHGRAAGPIRLSEHQARRFSGDVDAGPQSLEFNGDGYRNALPDRVVSYQAHMNDDGFATELESVTVQRGGRMRTFPLNDLIGVKVIHFRAGANNANVAVPIGYDGDHLAGLESDSLLHTGVLNPGGSVESLSSDPVLARAGEIGADSTPGMAVRFREDVVNHPGPDVVFFELQTVVNPPDGDAFHVSPLQFDDGLRSHTIRRYDIAMTSLEAHPLPQFDLYFFKEPATSLEALLTAAVDRRIQTLRFRALAVGIDLSDLGYADGVSVDGLFFQDALDDRHVVDPVFIAGLR